MSSRTRWRGRAENEPDESSRDGRAVIRATAGGALIGYAVGPIGRAGSLTKTRASAVTDSAIEADQRHEPQAQHASIDPERLHKCPVDPADERLSDQLIFGGWSRRHAVGVDVVVATGGIEYVPDGKLTGFEGHIGDVKELITSPVQVVRSAGSDGQIVKLLATDKLISFDVDTNTVRIDSEKIGPFNVVDGQHRIRGLVLAAEKAPTLEDFEIPVNIAVNLDAISQMAHFLIVNTTQRSVDKAIEQQIVARLTDLIEFEKTPVLPKWIQRQVDTGEDARALQIVQHLNDEKDSPWYGKIRMANDDDSSEDATINQKSFVTSLKRYVLTPSNPISGEQWSTDRQKKVLVNYWRAISKLLVEQDDETSVIFKTNGLNMFHAASPAIFLHLANVKDFKTETVQALMTRAFENLPADYIAVSTPAFWKRGSTASGLNQAAIRKYSTALATAMHSQPGSDGFSM